VRLEPLGAQVVFVEVRDVVEAARIGDSNAPLECSPVECVHIARKECQREADEQGSHVRAPSRAVNEYRRSPVEVPRPVSLSRRHACSAVYRLRGEEPFMLLLRAVARRSFAPSEALRGTYARSLWFYAGRGARHAPRPFEG